MLKARQQFALAAETFGRAGVEKQPFNDLDGNYLAEFTVDAFGSKHSTHSAHAHEFSRFEGSEPLAGVAGADLGSADNAAQKCFRTEICFKQSSQLMAGFGR